MSESLIVDWLNENEYRAYPLREINTDVTPYIVDASFVYDSLPITSYLTSVEVIANTVTVTVTGQDAFVFTITDSSDDFLYNRNSQGSLLVVSKKIWQAPSTYNLLIPFEDCVSSEFSGDWLGVSSFNIWRRA